MYRDNTKEWFFGNVNNENARAWRDEALPTDSADFDPDFLKLDREKRQKYFVERYEDVKQLEWKDITAYSIIPQMSFYLNKIAFIFLAHV